MRACDPAEASFEEFVATRDEDLRAQLIEAYMWLAASMARRFTRRGEPLDDLVQVASIGLVHAVDRFDPGREVTFVVYASRTIAGELKRHFRDRGWAIRPPRSVQELFLALGPEIERLTHENGRSPTIAELAEACDAPEEDVIEALDAGTGYWTHSTDLPRADGESIAAGLSDDDDPLAVVEQRAALAPGLLRLEPRERLIVHLRFGEGLTQAEIGTRLGLSQMHVSRLLRDSLVVLREAYGEQQLRDVIDL